MTEAGRRVVAWGDGDARRCRRRRRGRYQGDGQNGGGEQMRDGAALGGVGVVAAVGVAIVVLAVMAVMGMMPVMGVVVMGGAGLTAGETRERAIRESAGADLQREARAEGRRHEAGRDHGPQQQGGCEGNENLRPEGSPHPGIINGGAP